MAKRLLTNSSSPDPDALNKPDPAAVAITIVNHSTVLVQIQGLNILTDPVWSDRVGPFSRIGPKRARPPGIPFSQLPRIDLVVVSHNHYDHLDLPTLKRLYKRDKPRILVPLGDKKLLKSNGIGTAIEVDWWQSHWLNQDTEIVFAPARHNSGRTPWRYKKVFGVVF